MVKRFTVYCIYRRKDGDQKIFSKIDACFFIVNWFLITTCLIVRMQITDSEVTYFGYLLILLLTSSVTFVLSLATDIVKLQEKLQGSVILMVYLTSSKSCIPYCNAQ